MFYKKVVLTLAVCLAMQSPLTVLAESNVNVQGTAGYSSIAKEESTDQSSQLNSDADSGISGQENTETVPDGDAAAGSENEGTETGGQETEPGTGTEEPGTGTEEPGTGTEEPGTGTEEPGTGTEDPGAEPGTEEPGTGTEEPGTGTEDPGTEPEEPEEPAEEPETPAEPEKPTDYRNEWVFVNGQGWYYYNGSGLKATGWLWDNGAWYYLDGSNAQYPGLMLKNGAFNIGGQIYAFRDNGVMIKGWYFQNGEGWYYYNSSGVRQYGWLQQGGSWYYLDPDNEQYPGLMLKDCDRQIGNQIYAFNSSGVMKTGWYFKNSGGEDAGWYYFDSNGYAKTGWLWDGSEWYYLGPNNAQYRGLMYRNSENEIDGQIYSFSDSGVMARGWEFKFSEDESEGWYYYNPSGARQFGWQFLSGEWYYLSPKDAEHPGLMYRNCDSELDGVTYKFLDNGVMVRGWYWQDEKGWLYYNSSGVMQSGWVKDNGKWYYLDPENENIMVKDAEKIIGGTRYVFLNSGEMLIGWYFHNGEGWYYYDESGYLASGWRLVDGVWYYLDPANKNIMVTDLWKVIGGHWYSFNSNGSMKTNWSFINNHWYYFGSDGAARTGWQTIDGLRYYFYTANDPNGGVECAMAVNTTIDGIPISADGSASIAYGYAAQVLDSVGWNLRAAYNWSASIPWTATTANPSPGSEWFAVYGFENKTGNCYVMAATFYYMAKLLGYDAHQVTGAVPTVSGGLTPHSWVEIDMSGGTYVFDPDFTNETGRNGYQISYGTSGTWRYANYSRMN